MGTDEEYLAAVKELDEMVGLLAAEREARQRAEERWNKDERELQATCAGWKARAEQAEREIGLWRAETGAGRPEDAGAAIRHTREDLLEAETRAVRCEAAVSNLTAQVKEELRTVAELRQERDEARGDADAIKQVLAAKRVGYKQVLDERDRAEADNAALREALGAVACRPMETVADDSAHAEAVRIYTMTHPGAALLEYVRALEKVRDQLRDDVSAGCIRLVDECRELHEACVAADALKGKP